MFDYLLISIITYLGLITGYLIISFAPEEKEPGKKYFKLINTILFHITIILLLSSAHLYYIFFSALAVALYLVFKDHRLYIAYALFALAFYLFYSSSLFPFIALIIFIYGMSAGSLYTDLENKKKSLAGFLILLYFVLLANLLKIVL